MSNLDESTSVTDDYPDKFPGLCDITIRYQNTRFHIHSLILLFESVYFQTLYEKGVNQENRELLIPALSIPSHHGTISEVDMKQFFECLYGRGQFTFDDIIGGAKYYREIALIHLSHYFQVECILSRLKEINRVWLRAIGTPPAVWFALWVYQTYQWSDLFNELKVYIERYIETFMDNTNRNVEYAPYFEKYFFLLKEEVRADLLQKLHKTTCNE